uniref:Mitochondrial carrier protein n=1 Tax=Mantoniella antarctica TaxID=81844 RepID=A0A7S0T6P7_9CHLO|mmetsp:Transcript_9100/g.22426  ORF Transcript_9100/g.22426 Transcript_9100/m.22426 type:complete len:349 (+) Transcript_9100:42-1088(+)
MSISRDVLHSCFRSMLDAPGMQATTADRGVGSTRVPARFTAHSAGEAVPMQSELQKTMIKSAKDVFAGTCGGITVTLLGHPFDTVKVLLQTQPAKNPIYSGPLDAVKKVVQAEGVGGLYKGVTSPLAGQMFFRATLFFGYARAKDFVGVSPDDPLSYCKAGMMAWAAGSVFESPIDFYKSQWQSQILKAKQNPKYVSPYKNVGECVRESIKFSGIRGPFQGFGATLTRNLPAGAIYFGVFENTKNYFAARNENKIATDIQIMIAGGAGGFCYWSIFYPIDVIKSAMMTDAINPAERQYKGFLDAGSKLLKQGGWKRLYAGVVPCLLRASPANAGMLYTVDKIKQMLDA